MCTESAEQWLLLTCSFLEGGVGYAQGSSFVLQVSKQVSSLLDHTCPQLGSDLDSKFTLLVFGEVDYKVLLFFFPLPRQEGSDGIKFKKKKHLLCFV